MQCHPSGVNGARGPLAQPLAAAASRGDREASGRAETGRTSCQVVISTRRCHVARVLVQVIAQQNSTFFTKHCQFRQNGPGASGALATLPASNLTAIVESGPAQILVKRAVLGMKLSTVTILQEALSRRTGRALAYPNVGKLWFNCKQQYK